MHSKRFICYKIFWHHFGSAQLAHFRLGESLFRFNQIRQTMFEVSLLLAFALTHDGDDATELL